MDQHIIHGSSRLQMFLKTGVLKNFAIFTRKQLCQSLFLIKVAGLKAYNFIKKEIPIQVVFCEYCEIFKNSFFYRTPLVDASKSKDFVILVPFYILHHITTRIFYHQLACHNWKCKNIYLKERNFRVDLLSRVIFLIFRVDLILRIDYLGIFCEDLFSRILVLSIF